MRRPRASATARTVTSSWVGPMPPLVKTWSATERAWATAWTMASISSGMTCMDRSGIPQARSRRMSSAPFSSWIFPVRISLPTITAAAPRAMPRI